MREHHQFVADHCFSASALCSWTKQKWVEEVYGERGTINAKAISRCKSSSVAHHLSKQANHFVDVPGR